MKTFNQLNHVAYDCNYHIIFIQKYILKLSKDEREKYQELRSSVPTLWTYNFYSTAGNIILEKIKKYVEVQKTV